MLAEPSFDPPYYDKITLTPNGKYDANQLSIAFDDLYDLYRSEAEGIDISSDIQDNIKILVFRIGTQTYTYEFDLTPGKEKITLTYKTIG